MNNINSVSVNLDENLKFKHLNTPNESTDLKVLKAALHSKWAPSYKTLHLFKSESLMDSNGVIDPLINQPLTLSLEKNELARLKSEILDAKISVLLPKEFVISSEKDIRLEATIKEILLAVKKKAADLKIKIEKIELVGSAVPYILGESYYRRVIAERLSKNELPGELLNRLSNVPADIDIRVYVDPKTNFSSILLLNDEIMSVFGRKAYMHFDRNAAFSYLTSQNNRSYSNLKQTEPRLFALLAQNRNFKGKMYEKYAVISDVDKEYVISSLGSQKQVEIMIFSKLKRQSMFTRDDLRIPLLNLLEKNNENVCPQGNLQSLCDNFLNFVRLKDKPLVNEDDWFFQLYLKTKYGVIIPELEVEKELLSVVENRANLLQKGFKKIFLEQVQKIIDVHLNKDPLQAITFLFNACVSLSEAGQSEFANSFWSEMILIYASKIENLNDLKDPLSLLAKIGIHNQCQCPFSVLKAWLQVIGFLHLHSTESHSNLLKVQLNVDNGKKVLQLNIGIKEPSWLTIPFNLKEILNSFISNEKLFSAFNLLNEFYHLCKPASIIDLQAIISHVEKELEIEAEELENYAIKLMNEAKSAVFNDLGYHLLLCCQAMEPHNQYALNLLQYLPNVLIKQDQPHLALDLIKSLSLCSLSVVLHDGSLLESAKKLWVPETDVFGTWMQALARTGDPLIIERVLLMWDERYGSVLNTDQTLIKTTVDILEILSSISNHHAMRLFKKSHSLLLPKVALKLLLNIFNQNENTNTIQQQVELEYVGKLALGFMIKLKQEDKLAHINKDKMVGLIHALYKTGQLDIAKQIFALAETYNIIPLEHPYISEMRMLNFKEIWQREGSLKAAEFWLEKKLLKQFESHLKGIWEEVVLDLIDDLLVNEELVTSEKLLQEVKLENFQGVLNERRKNLSIIWFGKAFGGPKGGTQVEISHKLLLKALQICEEKRDLSKSFRWHVLNGLLEMDIENDILKEISILLKRNTFEIASKELHDLREKVAEMSLKNALKDSEDNIFINFRQEILRYQSWFGRTIPSNNKLLLDIFEKMINKLFDVAGCYDKDQNKEALYNQIFSIISSELLSLISNSLSESKTLNSQFLQQGSLGLYLFVRVLKHPKINFADKYNIILTFGNILKEKFPIKVQLNAQEIGYLVKIFHDVVFAIPIRLDSDINNVKIIEFMSDWLKILPVNPDRIPAANINVTMWNKLKVYLQKDIHNSKICMKIPSELQILLKSIVELKANGNIYLASQILAVHTREIVWNNYEEFFQCVKIIADEAKNQYFLQNDKYVSALECLIPTIMYGNQEKIKLEISLKNNRKFLIINPELLEYIVSGFAQQIEKMPLDIIAHYQPIKTFLKLYKSHMNDGICKNFPVGKDWSYLIDKYIYPTAVKVMEQVQDTTSSNEIVSFIMSEIKNPNERARLFYKWLSILSKLPPNLKGNDAVILAYEFAEAGQIFANEKNILVKVKKLLSKIR